MVGKDVLENFLRMKRNIIRKLIFDFIELKEDENNAHLTFLRSKVIGNTLIPILLPSPRLSLTQNHPFRLSHSRT